MSATAFQRMRREQAARESAEHEAVDFSELEALREQAKILGIENVDRKGEKRLREEIDKAKAEAEYTALKIKAANLGIEKVDEKGVETLRAEIAEKEAELAKAGDTNAGNND